jgi:hypothetical protein
MTELKSLAQIMIPDGQRLAKLYDNQGNLIWRASLWTGSERLNRYIDIKLSKTFGELPNGIVLYGTPRPTYTKPVSALTPDGGVQISQEDLLHTGPVLEIGVGDENPFLLIWYAGSLSSNVWPHVVDYRNETTYTLLKIVEG